MVFLGHICFRLIVVFMPQTWREFRRTHCFCMIYLSVLILNKNVSQIYPTELQLSTYAPFLDLYLSITNNIVSSKINDKRDDFNFEKAIFPFHDGDVPRSPSYGVYISQLIRFAKVCSNVDDYSNRNNFLLLSY